MSSFPTVPVVPQNPWVQILGALEKKVNRQSFDTWLKPTRFSHVKDRILVVRIPTADFRYIADRYDDLISEAGTDATRFFYLSRSNDQHLEFDVELARSHSNDNPVYYIQYAHARIASVFRQLEEKRLDWQPATGTDALAPLTAESELALILQLSRLPEVIAASAAERAPHLLVHYLGELAQTFHVWYNNSTFLVDVESVRNARLSLAQACRQTIAVGLDLLGVGAPERM